MRSILALTLVTTALVAQAPSSTQTLAQKVALESKTIQTLQSENPVEALEKAKALLPTGKLPFDKTNLQTAFMSINEWNAHIAIYKLIISTGISAGRFEEVKDAAEKAKDLAKELQKEANLSFDAYRETWTKSAENSTKLLTEIQDLEKQLEAFKAAKSATPKKKLTMEEENEQILAESALKKRLEALKPNEGTLKENLEKSKKAMTPIEPHIQTLEARTKEFDGSIEMWDKYLKEEAENIDTKYKNDKSAYAAGLLRGVPPKPEDKVAALVSLHRAAYLDPDNKAISRRIDQLMGKAPEDKPAKPAKPTKGKKK